MAGLLSINCSFFLKLDLVLWLKDHHRVYGVSRLNKCFFEVVQLGYKIPLEYLKEQAGDTLILPS